ncbi:MAG: response regulator transcription factor [Ardenticatenaceae bacterium]|nr:response regulator transcription factor [Ardenticatenaceae bacterium]
MHSPEPIKILIADDHAILRKTLSGYLSQEPKIQIVGETGSTSELMDMMRLSQPDILLLDVSMPGPGAFDTVSELNEQHPDVKIVILTATKNADQMLNLLRAGVNGYVLKEDNPRDLLQAIEAVANGEEWFSSRISPVLASAVRRQGQFQREQVHLTEREMDVLRLMVTGMGNDDIGEELFIATNTVKNHIRSIFQKLEVSTRVEAVVYALDHNLVDNTSGGETRSR